MSAVLARLRVLHPQFRAFCVELDESGGITNRLYVNFADETDESRFYFEEVPIACLIRGSDV